MESIVLCRLRNEARTQAYLTKLTKDGLSKGRNPPLLSRAIGFCLFREVYAALQPLPPARKNSLRLLDSP